MEETYTKSQLVEAMAKYNQKVKDEPGLFNENIEWTDEAKALNQIEYLISIINTGVAS